MTIEIRAIMDFYDSLMEEVDTHEDMVLAIEKASAYESALFIFATHEQFCFALDYWDEIFHKTLKSLH